MRRCKSLKVLLQVGAVFSLCASLGCGSSHGSGNGPGADGQAGLGTADGGVQPALDGESSLDGESPDGAMAGLGGTTTDAAGGAGGTASGGTIGGLVTGGGGVQSGTGGTIAMGGVTAGTVGSFGGLSSGTGGGGGAGGSAGGGSGGDAGDAPGGGVGGGLTGGTAGSSGTGGLGGRDGATATDGSIAGTGGASNGGSSGGSGSGGSGGGGSPGHKTYYVATDGADSGDGSATRPWATFAHAFDSMRSGDTLLIKDGVYHERIRAYYGSGLPSGSPGAYTFVKAEHDWAVTVYEQLRMDGGVSYVHIQGIHFMNGPDGIVGHHLKFIRCSFRGDRCTDNVSVVPVGAGSSYVLIEECFAYGCGRYKFLAYGDENGKTENIIFRRCVSRHDYHDPPPGWGRQCATFTSYDAHNVIIQNCISIDSGDPDPSKFGYVYGGFWFENKQTTGLDNRMMIKDSIAFNLASEAAINDPVSNGDRSIENTVIWKSQGGYLGSVRSGNPTLLLNHMTIGNIWGSFRDQSYAWGTGATANTPFAKAELTNSILTGCNSYGVANLITSDYNTYFDNGANYGAAYGIPKPTAGAHDIGRDPGLRYLFRVEPDSPVAGAGSDGKDLGANLQYKRGVSGTLYGEDGWDDLLTDQPLWPFPHEKVIKETMAAWDGQNDPKRGFCADGNGLYGGPLTLTSYLWEALGNPCPADVCPR